MINEFIEYPKIDTLYKRDTEGTKKLIIGDFRDPTVEFLKDNEWIGTEKIDGTNIGIVWDGHEVRFQGRTERAQLPKRLVENLTIIFKSNETEELFEQVFGEKSVILFGEGYGAGIQKGGNYILDNCSFILFDIFMPDSNLWLERKNVENIAKTFGIDVVPIVYKGNIDGAVNYIQSKPKSTIGTANMEGIVCRPAVDVLDRRGERIIVKVKVVDFE